MNGKGAIHTNPDTFSNLFLFSVDGVEMSCNNKQSRLLFYCSFLSFIYLFLLFFFFLVCYFSCFYFHLVYFELYKIYRMHTFSFASDFVEESIQSSDFRLSVKDVRMRFVMSFT